MPDSPVTAHITYQIDPHQIDEFEAYGKAWIALVDRFGGTHHGYFLPWIEQHGLRALHVLLARRL